MATIEDLQQEAERTEAEAQRLMAEKEDLRDALRKATDEAAAAQKALLDAQVVAAALERDDLRQSDIDRMAPGLAPEAREELQQGFSQRDA